MGEPTFFETEADFRQWLENNHETATELLVGFHKKASGRRSIDWPQARDQALCFGWIDGHRKSLDEDSYSIRFTPRRKDSIWSKVNIERFEALSGAGLMTLRGVEAWAARKAVAVYSYERPPAEFAKEEEAEFQAQAGAWQYWQGRAPSYRRSATHWVVSAKRPSTREKRLATLIETSAAGRLLPQYDWRKKP